MQYANVILIKGDKALMQLRDNKPGLSSAGLWSVPGGNLNKEESPKEAAIREFKEETGYNLKNPIFFKKLTYEFIEGNPEVTFFYEKYDGQQKISCFEGQKMEFKSLKKLDTLDSFPTHNALALEAIKKSNNI